VARRRGSRSASEIAPQAKEFARRAFDHALVGERHSREDADADETTPGGRRYRERCRSVVAQDVDLERHARAASTRRTTTAVIIATVSTGAVFERRVAEILDEDCVDAALSECRKIAQRRVEDRPVSGARTPLPASGARWIIPTNDFDVARSFMTCDTRVPQGRTRRDGTSGGRRGGRAVKELAFVPIERMPAVPGLAVPKDIYWILRGPVPLLGMTRPTSTTPWAALFSLGVHRVACLTDDAPDDDPSPLTFACAVGLQDLYGGARPARPEAEAEKIRVAAASVLDALDCGEGVVVNCAGGTGRTGTVIGAALVALGIPAADVIAHLQAVNKLRGRSWPESVARGAFSDSGVERLTAEAQRNISDTTRQPAELLAASQ
jgi:hypothetical protein